LAPSCQYGNALTEVRQEVEEEALLQLQSTCLFVGLSVCHTLVLSVAKRLEL